MIQISAHRRNLNDRLAQEESPIESHWFEKESTAPAESKEESIAEERDHSKISRSNEYSHRERMVDDSSDPITNDGGDKSLQEDPSPIFRSDKLFSEAAEIIDNSPSFNMDDFAGSSAIDEEFERATPETNTGHESAEEPYAKSDALTVGEEKPSALDEAPSEEERASFTTHPEPSRGFEEPLTVYEEPTTYDEESNSIENETPVPERPPLAYSVEPLDSDQEPSIRSTETSLSEEIETIAERGLADALAVIDDIPSFDIGDYSESNSDDADDDDQNKGAQGKPEESALDDTDGHQDKSLADAFSVINQTPSFNIEDYSQSAFDDEGLEDDQEDTNRASDVPEQTPTESVISVENETEASGISDSEDDSADDSGQSSLAETGSEEERPQAELFKSEALQSSLSDESDNDQVGDAAREEFQEQDSDQSLISEVDQLIEEKLGVDDTGAEDIGCEDLAAKDLESDEHEVINFGNANKSSALSRWVYAPLLSLAMLALIALLGYQLWLKQTTPLLESPQLAKTLGPVKQQLEKAGVVLPERRNLNQLELLSARTEAHPTRSSTILLRASLVNRANISQAFPWLELSLTDEDGRLVSRRALSPTDYLHNNRLENNINANELKQVTIELLSFPKQAHGFELRLLNK